MNILVYTRKKENNVLKFYASELSIFEILGCISYNETFEELIKTKRDRKVK